MADDRRVELTPGGVLGIEEHRLPEAMPQDAKASTRYVHESYVIRMAESAGFRLAAKSDVNANPKDKADHKGGVWALPPTLANRHEDRDVPGDRRERPDDAQVRETIKRCHPVRRRNRDTCPVFFYAGRIVTASRRTTRSPTPS